MFRLAVPLLVTAVASIDDDSVSLMQGMKPKEQKEDKSKAIANLMQSAANMLKNGATPDVVTFATETLESIGGTVIPSIQNAHDTDQGLITSTFELFQNALDELERGNVLVAADYAAERDLSTKHKSCRAEEDNACTVKRDCDYDLWEMWRVFVEEEREMRQLSLAISNHFCVNDPNGTTDEFRTRAVVTFPPWLEQKPIVEEKEAAYAEKVPDCERHFTALDTKTAECDALQTNLEAAACTYANTIQTVRNTFSEAWNFALDEYQRVVNEVHCLEIDRKKEWTTLKTVECLLDRTTARNGRPCDEATDEIQSEMAHCEEVRSTEDVSHLEIDYHVPPALPSLPAVPHAPCSSGYIDQEYDDLWTPPQPVFSETNSHCNQRQECGLEATCSLVQEVENSPFIPNGLTTFAANPAQVQIPTAQDECVPPGQGGQQD